MLNEQTPLKHIIESPEIGSLKFTSYTKTGETIKTLERASVLLSIAITDITRISGPRAAVELLDTVLSFVVTETPKITQDEMETMPTPKLIDLLEEIEKV